MAVNVEFLKRIPYFWGLSAAELDEIRKLMFEKAFERGEVIVIEGDSAEALYFVVSGVVRVFKTSVEGKEQILNIVRPGESFNDVPIFDGGPTPTSAQGMGVGVLYGIRRSSLEPMLRERPQVALNVIRVLAAQVRKLLSLVEDLSFRRVIGRVARILLENAGGGTTPMPRLSQQEMAGMAGTAREVVGRSLKALEEQGVIRLDRHRIVITDKEGLRGIMEAPA